MQKVGELIHKSKMAKQKSENGNVSPVLMKYLSFSSSSSSSSNSRSSMDMVPFSPVSIMSKLSSSTSNRGQMSAVDEEDVLVIDGLPITRYSPSPSPSPSSTSKTELCRSWEEFGMCRFGTKCQFAHGKKELRPARFPTIKNKSESLITGSCIYGSKCQFIHQAMTDSALVLTIQMEDHNPMKASVSKTTPMNPITFKSQATNTFAKSEQTRKTTTLITKTVQSDATSTTNKDYWSPQDDGIEVTLPSHPGKPQPREKVDEYIDNFLYCPSTAARRRLPVFAKICPEYRIHLVVGDPYSLAVVPEPY